MIQEKATAVIFLCFSITVAFFNIILGNYQYILFIIPFIASCIFRGNVSKILEVIGLECIAIYLVSFQDVSIGILVFIISNSTMLSSSFKQRANRFVMYFNGAFVFICSMVSYHGIQSIFTHAILDFLMYAVCAFCVYCSFDRITKKQKPVEPIEKTIDEKYIIIIDELQSIAHEYIEILKQKQKEAMNDRPRKTR